MTGRQATPVTPIGVAIAGCAHVPHALAYAGALAASSNARVAGVWDDDPALASRVAERAAAPVVADVEELIASPATEAVVLAGTTAGHERLALLAAAHGRHLLVEKPLATTVAGAQAIVDACAVAGVRLHVAFVTRFYPIVQQLRARIEAGELGELIGMVGGNRGRPPLPPQYPAWITDPVAAGGGALLDHSVHVSDVMRHVTGREVVSVSAEIDSGLWKTAVDDTALLLLQFDGGPIASIDPSWSVPEHAPISYDFYVHVVGSKGAMTITDTNEAISLVAPGVRPGLITVPFGIDIDQSMIECFLRSIRAGTTSPPGATGIDGVRAVEIALAGYESARTGQPVVVGPAAAS